MASSSGNGSGRKKSARKAVMLGLGMDSDGHKRMTEGPNFLLVGGSKDTHEVMTEKVIKINEKLAAAGKTLENVSREQMDDIAGSLGLRPEKLPVNGKHLPLGKPHPNPNHNPPENGYC